MQQPDRISRFYLDHISGATLNANILKAPCPFCKAGSDEEQGMLVVFLNPEGHFHGYFRCMKRCVPGGFPLYFARLAGIDLHRVPGFDPDRDHAVSQINYPMHNINNDIIKFRSRLTDDLLNRFNGLGIAKETLDEMQIGYNGRYLVYPYIQEDGNCYAARCVHPERAEDHFWYGDSDFFGERFRIFNVGEIDRCENGTLIIVEGEENLLTIKEVGLPAIAVATVADLDGLNIDRFRWIHTLFLCVTHCPESVTAARALATRLGYKARIIRWPEPVKKSYSLIQMAAEQGNNFRKQFFTLIREAKSFSPFSSPEREHYRFLEHLNLEKGEAYGTMRSGFPLMDQSLGGIHGINVIGGSPKAGKSCLLIQIATDMALRKIPVIYYDFENGRQKIYQRTICRLSRLPAERIKTSALQVEDQNKFSEAEALFKNMLPWLRIVTDRKLNPEIMRRHIDFLRHETNSPFTVVVIDSLHKLPFQEFSEMRSGIDAWLRQFEAIRDELNVSFLIVSELSRNQEGHYDRQPHLGSFKGSGDIGYSADNAMVFLPEWDPFDTRPQNKRYNTLWLVASREHSPGKIASYRLDYPYWGFVELQ